MDTSFFDLPAEKVLRNTKTKRYPDGSTTTIYCNNAIWIDNEIAERYKEEIETAKEIAKEQRKVSEGKDQIKKQKKRKTTKTDRERTDSIKRSRDKCFDIARLNHWKYFITVTFNGSEFDSSDPAVVMKKLRDWLGNRVRRDGLKYLLIPEYHKSGRIHCHALVNDKIAVVDSGTRLVKGYSKPVKLETIERLGLTLRSSPAGGMVYNIPAWKFGFSTAIEVDNSNAFAFYITKYITKGNKKIFGSYYWSSRNCVREPEIVYSNTEFYSIDRAVYQPGGYKFKYQSNCHIIPDFDKLSAKFDDISSFLEYIYSEEYKKEVEKYEQNNTT